MIDRREMTAGVLASGASTVYHSIPAVAATTSYEAAVEATWAPLRLQPLGRELVRFASLAANSHNSQPWFFSVSERRIVIAPDFNRRCSAVDPDDHHVFVSLGCAAENIIQTAGAMGLQATLAMAGDKIEIDLEPAPPIQSELFKAIIRRQCTRAMYDGKPASSDDLRLLETASLQPGISVVIRTDEVSKSNIIDFVVEGNSAQMRDKAFMKELRSWIRFSEADAVARMDGLFSRASGNPAMPAWLARPLLNLVFTATGENKKYREHIASSAGIAVFASAANDKAHWVAAGRACQRFALQATALGLKYAFVNQPVEIARLRPQLESYLGLANRRADLIVRFGAGPELPKSLRRPPELIMR